MGVPKEVRLCLALMMKNEEVPPNIRERAVNALKSVSMMIPEGEAEAYLMDKLIEAIESGDPDEVEHVCKLIGIAFGFEPGLDDEDDGADIEVTDEMKQAVVDSINDFVNAYSDEFPEQLLLKILDKLSDEMGVIPVHFEDDFLIMVMKNGNGVVAWACNQDIDAVEAMRKFQKVDKTFLSVIRRQWNVEGEIDVKFMGLGFSRLDDLSFELVSYPL